MRIARPLTFLLLAGSTVLSAACPDTGASFDDFAARYEEINPATSSSSGISACEVPIADDAEVTGDWLFSLSARLDPKQAFVLNATITAELQMDGTMLVDMTLVPLSADDQMTPVSCPTITFTDLLVNADGTFNWLLADDAAGLTLCGDANPITGSDIVTGLSISGTICGGPAAGFVCGPVTGKVSVPAPIDLAGSTYTIQKVMGTPPAPVINCDKVPAEYM